MLWKTWSEDAHPRDEHGRFAGSAAISVTVSSDGQGKQTLRAQSELGHVHGDLDPATRTIHDPTSHVRKEGRGKGHGVALYQAFADRAAEMGYTIHSANPVTIEAARVYEALGRRGYDVVRHPKAKEEGAATIGYNNMVAVHGEKIGRDAVYTIRPKPKKSAPGAHQLYK